MKPFFLTIINQSAKELTFTSYFYEFVKGLMLITTFINELRYLNDHLYDNL